MAQEQTPGASSASAKSPPQQANLNTVANLVLAGSVMSAIDSTVPSPDFTSTDNA